jgi:hypothetical protein
MPPVSEPLRFSDVFQNVILPVGAGVLAAMHPAAARGLGALTNVVALQAERQRDRARQQLLEEQLAEAREARQRRQELGLRLSQLLAEPAGPMPAPERAEHEVPGWVERLPSAPALALPGPELELFRAMVPAAPEAVASRLAARLPELERTRRLTEVLAGEPDLAAVAPLAPEEAVRTQLARAEERRQEARLRPVLTAPEPQGVPYQVTTFPVLRTARPAGSLPAAPEDVEAQAFAPRQPTPGPVLERAPQTGGERLAVLDRQIAHRRQQLDELNALGAPAARIAAVEKQLDILLRQRDELAKRFELKTGAPGGYLYRIDPETEQPEVVGQLPERPQRLSRADLAYRAAQGDRVAAEALTRLGSEDRTVTQVDLALRAVGGDETARRALALLRPEDNDVFIRPVVEEGTHELVLVGIDKRTGRTRYVTRTGTRVNVSADAFAQLLASLGIGVAPPAPPRPAAPPAGPPRVLSIERVEE